MKPTITVDTVAEDPNSDEFVLHLLEDVPWPKSRMEWDDRSLRIQNRILDAFDAAVDGGVAKKYPDSVGRKMRIQIDSPHGEPPELRDLIERVANFISSNREYAEGLRHSKHVAGIRVVTGHELGRFSRDAG